MIFQKHTEIYFVQKGYSFATTPTYFPLTVLVIIICSRKSEASTLIAIGNKWRINWKQYQLKISSIISRRRNNVFAVRWFSKETILKEFKFICN